jgi:predicted nuclease with TOPRIM domain
MNDMQDKLKRAEAILKKLDKMERVNSIEFGIIYEEITGTKYIFENCFQCFKKAVAQLRAKYLELKSKCSTCNKEKVQDVPRETLEEVEVQTLEVEEIKEEVKDEQKKSKSSKRKK